MKKIYYLNILLLTCNISNAQNLVLNGSFENYSGCPTNFSQIDSAMFWTVPTIGSSSDYYNQCADASSSVDVPFNGPGFQEAYNGVAYAGIYLVFPGGTDYREYIEVPLADTLVANGCYHFEMYVNLTNTCQYTTDAIGAYFSDTAITGVNNFYPLPVTPQISNTAGNLFDTINWTLVTGEYLATGNETHLIIGNFKDDASSDLILINNSAPFDFVYALVDHVSLNQCKPTGSENFDSHVISIYPNPISDQLNIQMSNYEQVEVILYDLTFRKLLQQEFSHAITLNTGHLANGFYLYEIRDENNLLKRGLVLKQ
jgi:hypothetical protein